MVLAAVGTGMIASAAVSVWQQSLQFAENRREVLLATAHAFSAAVAIAAANRDASGAFAAIRGIGEVPNLLYAEVRSADGRALTTLGSAPRLVGDASLDETQSVLDLLSSQTLLVTAPIVHGGRSVGRLVLIAGTAGLWTRLLWSVATTAFAGLIALAVGLAVGWRFQRGISRPLGQLVAAMARVREHHRYDVYLEDAGDREVGLLIDGFNAMLHDIRERDARLETHRRNLEKEVAERTSDLRDARDAAEAANRAKSDFLATMSHEIRTPMNGIMVMAELLAQGDMPPRQRRCADVIVNSGQSLLAIINDILDFSKIEAGKLALESVPFTVSQIADTTVSLFAERARSKNIDLAALVDPTTPRMIMGDPVRLTQIASNLINNALKFTEHGYVHLVIGPASDRPGFLSIAVRDTGVGIPSDKLQAIFDAFSQADQSTTRQYGGTGLGLAICKRLITAMGGEIVVTSAFGQGSTFTVTVPASRVEVASQPSGWPQLDLTAGRHAICVLDLQGEATTATAARYFSASGYIVVEADEYLSTPGYQDMSLACVSAERLQRPALRRREGRKPVVIAVAELGDAAAERLVEGSFADAILTKPLLRADVEQLLTRIAAGEPMRALQAPTTKPQVAREFPGLRVLVADDSPVNREVAVTALSRLGAVTGTVDSGAQAIAAVENDAFDVVLMDGSMPDVDGFTAAREIRSRENRDRRRRLPIVALTAHVVGTAAQAWRDAGMDDIVYKPYSLAQLSDCLQRLFPDWSAGRRAMASERIAEGTEPADATDAAGPGLCDDLLDIRILQDLEAMAGTSGQDFVQRIFRLYTDNAPRGRDELDQAVRQDDREACARAAHFLKSMSQNIGARQVAACAGAIEQCARESGIPPAEDLQSLDRLLDATMAMIAARLSVDTLHRAHAPQSTPSAGSDAPHARAR